MIAPAASNGQPSTPLKHPIGGGPGLPSARPPVSVSSELQPRTSVPYAINPNRRCFQVDALRHTTAHAPPKLTGERLCRLCPDRAKIQHLPNNRFSYRT
jgi:hypothetical protein